MFWISQFINVIYTMLLYIYCINYLYSKFTKFIVFPKIRRLNWQYVETRVAVHRKGHVRNFSRRALFPYRHLTVKSDRRLSSWAGILRESRGDWCSLYTRKPYPPTFTLLFQDVHTGDSLIRIAALGVSGSTILSSHASLKTHPWRHSVNHDCSCTTFEYSAQKFSRIFPNTA